MGSKSIRSIKGITSITRVKGARGGCFAPQGGFTLVELIVYMGIFSILIIALTQIFMTIIETQLKTQGVTSSAQDGQYLYSRLIYDVHHADAILTPATLGAVGNSLQLTVDGATHTYSLNGTALILNDGTGSYQLNAYDTDISGLQFHRLGNIGGKHTVRVNFTVTSKSALQGNPEIRYFQTTAGLR